MDGRDAAVSPNPKLRVKRKNSFESNYLCEITGVRITIRRVVSDTGARTCEIIGHSSNMRLVSFVKNRRQAREVEKPRLHVYRARGSFRRRCKTQVRGRLSGQSRGEENRNLVTNRVSESVFLSSTQQEGTFSSITVL